MARLPLLQSSQHRERGKEGRNEGGRLIVSLNMYKQEVIEAWNLSDTGTCIRFCFFLFFFLSPVLLCYKHEFSMYMWSTTQVFYTAPFGTHACCCMKQSHKNVNKLPLILHNRERGRRKGPVMRLMQDESKHSTHPAVTPLQGFPTLTITRATTLSPTMA